MVFTNNYYTFASEIKNGTLADRLGNGLQNRVEQFDSARYLNKKSSHWFDCFFLLFTCHSLLIENNVNKRRYIYYVYLSVAIHISS